MYAADKTATLLVVFDRDRDQKKDIFDHDERWPACDACHEDIEEGRWATIAARAVLHTPGMDTVVQRVGLAGALDVVGQLHQGFSKARRGHARRVA
jgi:hypothetical protein